MQKYFPGVVLKEPEGFTIIFPAIKGCHSEGETLEECLAMGQEALNGMFEHMAKNKEEFPEPSELKEAAKKLPKSEQKLVFTTQLVAGVIPGRSKKFMVSMDEELLKRVDASAGSYGRSKFLAAAAKAKLASAS